MGRVSKMGGGARTWSCLKRKHQLDSIPNNLIKIIPRRNTSGNAASIPSLAGVPGLYKVTEKNCKKRNLKTMFQRTPRNSLATAEVLEERLQPEDTLGNRCTLIFV